ncbi:abnormal cell lineage family protein [Desulforamulus putei]|nr:abnormal cell lineage family protein [Desulforamulus putei]
MVTEIMEIRKRNQLKKLNALVKEILEIRQYLKYFEGLDLPDYQAMISQVPPGVESGLLIRLQQRQSREYYGYFELKSKEAALKEAIQKASEDLESLLKLGK